MSLSDMSISNMKNIHLSGFIVVRTILSMRCQTIIRLSYNQSFEMCLIYFFIYFVGTWELLRDWTTFDNDTFSVNWLNFHLNHRDCVKLVLNTTNGALITIQNETNGCVVDLTPPKLLYLGDGVNPREDRHFQVIINS